jgi:uncharacterized protein involved in exopolysaccharide biosynthesis
MNEYLIKPSDIFDIIKRHKVLMTTTFSGAFIFVILLYLVVPRTYRSEVVIHIGVNYFQNPLIGDLISQTHDPSELRAEREKIIKSALGVDFANEVGEKYKLFKTDKDDKKRAIEIDYFLKSLDISPVTTTQFSIKYKGRTSDVTDGVIHDAIGAIRKTMYSKRMQMLEEFYVVLQDEITNAGGVPATRSFGTRETTEEKIDQEKEQISAQIQVLEKRLADMQRSYNSNHPSVRAISNEIAVLKDGLRSGNLSSRLTRRRFLSKSGGKSDSMIRDGLTRQEHLLNISLEMEKKDPTMSSYVTLVKEPIYPKNPVFPHLRLFLLMALIFGIMAATVSVALSEFWLRSEVSPKLLAESLKVESFGKILIPSKG